MDDNVHIRNQQLGQLIHRLALRDAYDNYRPINVPARFDGQTLLQCLVEMHPHVGRDQWQSWFRQGHILAGETPAAMETIVRGGNQYQHLFPHWVDPEVDSKIVILWEDESIIGLHKPAPLPVHPSGRYNRNTLTALLRHVYEPDDLRIVHRLDANTTGVMVLARTASAANSLRLQFERDQIHKRYLVRCEGQPQQDCFSCNDRIAKQAGPAGQRSLDPNGREAITEFHVLRRMSDGTALIQARPITGRTNQIRIHLWSMGIPVSGDPTYLPNRRFAESQTRSIDDPPMCLHASKLRLTHPATGQSITISAHEPDWLDRLA